jgi:hypothetical protein
MVLGGLLVGYGSRYRKPLWRALGIITLAVLPCLFWFLDFWAEMLWFSALGYAERFWTTVMAQGLSALCGLIAGWGAIHFLNLSLSQDPLALRMVPRVMGAILGGLVGLSNWQVILKYLHRPPTPLADPVLEKSTSFYLFALPLYDVFYVLFLLLFVLAFLTVAFSMFVRISPQELQFTIPDFSHQRMVRKRHDLCASAVAILLALAFGRYLDRFHLMYSSGGVVNGAGWTDVNVRLPGDVTVAAVCLVCAFLLGVPPLRRRIGRLLTRPWFIRDGSGLLSLPAVGFVVLVVWIGALGLAPGLLQWLHVEPNEITMERPYISNNIRFTRHGFDLHDVEEKEYPVRGDLTRRTVQENQNLFANVRLWDWRALDAVYKQFQEIRLYYEFEDVDIDRYYLKDDYRQVMISAREMQLANLPEDSQTFVNRRFKFTHGYGITLNTVSEFTPEGLPHLLVKDIPPKSEYPSLEVSKPQIYYGELTDTPVVANSKEQEFDYPRGEENVYIHYPGTGGVPIRNLWRKFLFGWKFDGTRFLLSSYITPESRLLFHRQIKERVKRLAPFLRFDRDPYLVVVDGKLYWIIDGYTTATRYPYSEPFLTQERTPAGVSRVRRILFRKTETAALNDVNYIRNSVKAVVDAFNGSVDFYIFEEEDPVIQVWSKIFPSLFRQQSEMPEEIRLHVRYPADMLLVQGLVYAKYHMTDPTVFYNQEDLWVRATEKYYDRVQPVEPYYIIWEQPGSDKPEFVLILPFTPKGRQVLIGWIAGMCDGENYGRLLAYKFPKEKRVLGTQQVETKIDQDRHLSGQLSLWDQRGSKVIRGNVLAIPVEETLLYVEPIYLQAETAAYPELRLVATMHNDRLSYAETFSEALKGLFEKGRLPDREGPVKEDLLTEELIQKANKAFEDYISSLGNKQFGASASALSDLEKTLQRLADKLGDKDGRE